MRSSRLAALAISGMVLATLPSGAALGVVVVQSTGAALGGQITAIAPGAWHTCALVAAGNVWCWGHNASGELGDATTAPSLNPVAVVGEAGTGVLAGVTAIDAGSSTNCALLSDGTIDCWGNNGFGQLGDGTTVSSAIPLKVRNPSGSGPLTGATAIAANGAETCAIVAGGGVDCWGDGTYGALGDGDGQWKNSSLPVQVQAPGGGGPLQGATAIASDQYRTCVLLSTGGVDCWGYLYFTAENLPVPVRDLSGSGILTGVSAIAVGQYHSCALLAGGAVACWGYNGLGQLGNGTTTDAVFPVEVEGPSGQGVLTGVTSLDAGAVHTCALLDTGTVDCWVGSNGGALGDGTAQSSTLPVQTKNSGGSGPLTDVTAIETNWTDSCAVVKGGMAYCWGSDTYGQLGDGTTTDSLLPVLVQGFGASPSTVTCTPGDANTSTTITSSEAVGCAFTQGGDGAAFTGWTATGFSVSSPSSPSARFTPVAGQCTGTITGTTSAGSTAFAYLTYDPAVLGPCNPAWDAYYKDPAGSSQGGFCAAGGGSVLFDATGVAGGGVPGCLPLGTETIWVPSCTTLGGAVTDINGKAIPRCTGDPTSWPATPRFEKYTQNGVDYDARGFQCPELAERYLFVRYGVTSNGGNGAQIAGNYAAAGDGLLVSATTTAKTKGAYSVTVKSLPVVGDVVSLSGKPDFSDVGHVAVVAPPSLAKPGMMILVGQNWGTTGELDIPVAKSGSGWSLDMSGTGGLVYLRWLHTAAQVSYIGPTNANPGATLQLTAQLRIGAAAAAPTVPLAGMTVTFGFNGQYQSVSTGPDGVARWTVTAPMKKNSYPVTVAFGPDAPWGSSTDQTKIAIK